MFDGSRYRQIIIYILMLVASGLSENIFSQINQPAPTRQSAAEAFARGNYQQAYAEYSRLLEKYPRDPLYLCYTGACLVNLKQDPERALKLLDQSVNGASVVKSLPDEALFYLGRAQQMNGKFTEAIESYNSFTAEAGKKAAREMEVPVYIQECENRKGMVAAASIIPAAAETQGKKEELLPQPAKNTEKTAAQYPQPKAPVAEEAVSAGTSGRKDLPPEYEVLLDDAMKLQYRADSLTQLAAAQKKQLDTLQEDQKSTLRVKIYQNEMLADSYQKSADNKYAEAQARMNRKQEPATQKTDPGSKPAVKEQPAPAAAVKPPEMQAEQKAPAKEVPAPAAALVAKGATVLFAIIPANAAYPDEKIKVDPEIPAGLIYRIQLAVFRNPVAPPVFRGITPVHGFRLQGTDKTVYYAGMFRKSADARTAMIRVKETGFKDAFIVSLVDGKQVSADRAAVLENEWGSKPFFEPGTPGTAVADTLPPALVFRVEVARSVKPMKPDAVETLRSLAGNRGMDIIRLADGNNVYLIGKFITFESAAEYADLLIRNNYRNAKVVAWLGTREVPVETAKKLFNGIE